MPQPEEYDYGDPEFWELLGNEPEQAEKIATCFPEYWQHAFSWPNAKEIARTYREYHWTYFQYMTAPNPFSAAASSPAIPAKQRETRSPGLDDSLWKKVVKRALTMARWEGITPSKRPTSSVRKRLQLPDGAIYVNGHRLTTQEQLRPIDDQSSLNSKGPQWGPVRLPRHAHKGHYCIVGMTRSGKTAIIRLLAASLKEHCRFVVYDDKTDLVPFFTAEPDSPAAPLHILNPFDSRSLAWDIAKDAYAPHRADEIAHVLIPDQPGQNPYFVETPRALIAATINALNRSVPGKWSFLDLLIALENIQTVLQHDEPLRRVFNKHLAAAKETAADLISTLDGQIRPFKTAAAAWSHAKQRLSITEWALSGTGTLVLGNHANYEYAMCNINRLLFHLLARALLDPAVRAQKRKHRTYIILDELHQLHFLRNSTRYSIKEQVLDSTSCSASRISKS